MATLRNIPKLAARNSENHEEHPKSNLAQNASAPQITRGLHHTGLRRD